jgi:ABC-type uncharacterized transport system permease subunit
MPQGIAVHDLCKTSSGKLSAETLLFAVMLALTLGFLSRRFWLFGIKFYSGASA